MNVTLVTVDPEGNTRDVPLKRARLLIGRRAGCDVRIPIASISREHCELRVEGGKLLVRDMGSSNGTYVNRQRIQEQEVNAGDLIAVGPAVFVARIDGNPQQIDPAASYHAGSAPQPVAATTRPGARPASPTAETRSIPAPKPGKAAGGAAKPKPLVKDDDDDFDLRAPGDSSDSSDEDLDFDFLDEDEEDKKKL